jgi:hypothetical protein
MSWGTGGACVPPPALQADERNRTAADNANTNKDFKEDTHCGIMKAFQVDMNFEENQSETFSSTGMPAEDWTSYRGRKLV